MKKRYTYNRFTGTDIIINEAARGVVEKLGFECNSSQVSKNLLNIPNGSLTDRGITGVITNNSILTYSGIATNVYANITATTTYTLPAGTYTFSIDVATTGNERIVLYLFGGTAQNAIIPAGSKSATFTSNGTNTSYRVGITNTVIGNSYSGTFKMQLELGSTATTWTSFNPTPDYPVPIYNSGDEGKIAMWSHKKNICFTDINEWESGDYFNENGTKIPNANRVRLKELLRVEPSTAYYFNLFPTTSSYKFLIRTYDQNKAFVKSVGVAENGGVYNVTSTEKYFGISIYNSAGIPTDFTAYTTLFNNGDIKPFICLNTETNKSYEPYFGSTTDITLPKNLFNGIYTEYAIGGSSTKQYFTSPGTRTAVINVNPLTTYTIKKVGGNRFNICENDTYPIHNEELLTQLYYNSNDSQATITTGANGRYLCIYTTNDGTNPQMQVELGSIATAYEPYVGYVGGSLPNGVADTDTQQKIKKITINSSTTYSWALVASTMGSDLLGAVFNISDSKNLGITSMDNINFRCSKLTNKLLGSTTDTTNVNNVRFFEGIAHHTTVGTQFVVSILKSRLAGTTLADIQNYIYNNFDLYYELATPVDITITKPQIPTYEGINTITTTNNVKPSLTIEAWKR